MELITRNGIIAPQALIKTGLPLLVNAQAYPPSPLLRSSGSLELLHLPRATRKRDLNLILAPSFLPQRLPALRLGLDFIEDRLVSSFPFQFDITLPIGESAASDVAIGLNRPP
jgi:hypothetical protein